jgi:hypothetical protein
VTTGVANALSGSMSRFFQTFDGFVRAYTDATIKLHWLTAREWTRRCFVFDRKRIIWFVGLCLILALAFKDRFQGPKAWHEHPRLGNLAGIGWVGIAFDGVMDHDSHRLVPSALRVTRVVAGGPADQAGLRSQDIIIRLNGRPFADVLQMQDDVARMRVGDALRLDVRRDGQELSFTMKLVSWRHIVDLSRKTPGDGISL